MRDALSRAGLDVLRGAGEDNVFAVGPAGRGDDASPVSIELPDDLLEEYVAEVSADYRASPDPRARALGMMHVLLMEILTTDHGGGSNLVRAVGLRRGDDGHVAFTAERDDPAVAAPHGDDELRWTAERPAD